MILTDYDKRNGHIHTHKNFSMRCKLHQEAYKATIVPVLFVQTVTSKPLDRTI